MELRIELYSTYQKKEYYKLFSNPSDLIAVAEKENLDKLKELIDLEAQSTINRLRELLQNIDSMQYLLNTFHEAITDISHDASVHGLQGQCCVERELLVSALRRRIMRFFLLKYPCLC